MKLQKVKVTALPDYSLFSHSTTKIESRSTSHVAGAKFVAVRKYRDEKQEKKEYKKKRQEDKEGRTRGGIRKPRSATAHLRIVMLTPARSNNRHQAQWRNPC